MEDEPSEDIGTIYPPYTKLFAGAKPVRRRKEGQHAKSDLERIFQGTAGPDRRVDLPADA